MSLLELRARRSPKLTIAAAITAGVLLLGGAVGVGLRWPRSWFGFGPDDDTDFDYSALARALERLNDDYLRSFLGGGSSPSGSAQAGRTRLGRKAAPLNVAHPFTNDDFEHAYDITSLPFRATTDTSGAKRQSGEPSDCLPAGGTAWYRYKAPADLALFSDTFGTSQTTALGVYSGNSRKALSLIGCDTNVLGNTQVGFRATAGSTYYFQMTGAVKGGPTVFGLAAVGPTTLETTSATGGRPDGHTHSYLNHSELSTDGRFITFVSRARNLTTTRAECGGAPECTSLYLRDRSTGKTTLIFSAAAPTWDPESALFWHPTLSPDGRYVGFTFWELPGWPGFQRPIEAEQMAMNAYLYDRLAGSLELVARNSNGEAARARPGSDGQTVLGPAVTGSYAPSISEGGRYVLFNSDGANLGGHVEYGNAFNVYRRDRVTGVTRLVSTDAEGRPMRANSYACTGRNLSGDGRYAFFASTYGTGQQTGDAGHGTHHLYLWDASTGRTRVVTKLPDGVQTKGNYCPAISLDGSRTAFVSRDALIAEDTNGTPDVYSYEVATGRLKRASVTSAGDQTTDLNYYSTDSSQWLPRSVTLSADGRYIAFDSSASELTPSSTGSTRYSGPGTPGPIQVYVHDILTGATVLASVSSIGEPLPGNSVVPYISHDGRKVSFMNSGSWTSQNSVSKLDVLVHELR